MSMSCKQKDIAKLHISVLLLTKSHLSSVDILLPSLQ